MTTETLKQAIEARYKSKRAFIIAFNEKAGFEALDETTLSRQLSERISLSAAWKCAYKFFFNQTQCNESV
jgi:hypothetical protein